MSDDAQYPTFASGDLPTTGPAPGAGMRVLGGRFELVRQLGRGGMGVVWLARDLALEMEVALKFLPDAASGDPVALEELRREARRCMRLTHPNIVRAYDWLEDGSAAGISMEYVEGRTLSEMRLAQPGQVFEPDALGGLMGQVCAALDHAHGRGVIHRDLKPSNIMIDAAGVVRVMDFGIARALGDSMTRLTGRGLGSGTLPYMSPQQLLGETPAPADDVYALGATIYELLTGKPPFHSGSIERQIEVVVPPPMARRRADLGVGGAVIPAAWEEAVAACLAKETGRRPATPGQVWQLLSKRDAVSSAPVPAAQFPMPPPAAIADEGGWSSTPRHKRLSGWIGAVCLAGLIVVFALWLGAEESRRKAERALAESNRVIEMERMADERPVAEEKPRVEAPAVVPVVAKVLAPAVAPIESAEPASPPASAPASAGPPSAVVAPSASTTATGFSRIREIALLVIEEIKTKETGRDTDEAQVDLEIPIRRQRQEAVDAREVRIQVDFYDMIGDHHIVLTNADVKSRWRTSPANWDGDDTEIVSVFYRALGPELGVHAQPGGDGKKALQRRYLGHVVRVYYRGQLQDMRANPGRLLDLFPPSTTLNEREEQQ